MKTSDQWQVSDGRELCASHFASCHPSRLTRRPFAFTLVELLVVIVILGILAGLAVPALKNIGKSDANTSAARQLLDDVGRARQFAISQHTTVYMVFVPMNFWLPPTSPSGWTGTLTPAELSAATNLCDKQLTGYTFIGTGAVGDQPGRHAWHYLAPWQNLPDGTFIAQQKFQPRVQSYNNNGYTIYGFSTNGIPFPFETSHPVNLPYVAFNYLGQPVSGQDEYIPLAGGSVLPAINPATRTLQLGTASVSETPPGNSTNSAYNIVHIDALTGRAVLEFQKLP